MSRTMDLSKIKNWSLVTKRDFLIKKYGYGMPKNDWEWCTGEGKEISKEQHLAFEVGLMSEKVFYPKEEFKKTFLISGYAKKYGYSRGQQPVLRPDGEIGDIILTSNLAWAQKEGETIVICTKSGSLYELENMIREKDYLKPEDTGMSTEELNSIMHKYFTIKGEVDAL